MYVHFFKCAFNFGETVAKLLFKPFLNRICVLSGEFSNFVLIYTIEIFRIQRVNQSIIMAIYLKLNFNFVFTWYICRRNVQIVTVETTVRIEAVVKRVTSQAQPLHE